MKDRTKASAGSPATAGVASVEASSPQIANPWILNAWSDLVFFVGTPLLIIPLISVVRGYLTVADISLYVLSFGAMGHHLPGMLRAYGDRELFARFRVRFIVAPLFLLAVCIFFAYRDLNGLLVMALLWGTWHGLAQVYGFLRIYDAKARSFAPLTARLDLAMCVAWFGLGVVLSPDRMQAVLKALYDSGGPLIPAANIHWLQSAWAVATGGVTAAFAANGIWQSWQGQRPSGLKLLLMISSFGFWWYAMLGVDNIILGIAMFEIFHDVQYLAIVWIYNVKRVEKTKRVGAFTHFLFRRSWVLVGLYAGLVFAYGYINLFTKTVAAEHVQLALFGLVSASAFLHFYYDGFIWKVREKSTREGLGLTGGRPEPADQLIVPGWFVHGLKWSLFIVPAALLATTQLRGVRPGLERQLAIVEAVPNSADAQHDLGVTLAVLGRQQQAVEHLQRALVLNPAHARARNNLGISLHDLGRTEEAITQWQEALRIKPDYAEAYHNWASALQDSGRFEEAVSQIEQALRIDPDYAEAHYCLGNALQGLGRTEEAITQWQEAVRIKPDFAEAYNNWGIALLGLGQFEQAVTHLGQALQAKPDYAEAHCNLGNALVALGNFTYSEAAAHYQEALRIDPDYAEAHNAWGIALAGQGRIAEAAEHFQRSLELDPANTAARMNLRKAQQLLPPSNAAGQR